MSNTVNTMRGDIEWAIAALVDAVRVHKDAEFTLAERRSRLAKLVFDATEPPPVAEKAQP